MHPDYHNFDSLRRLLKLKRHEEPPPGYFDRFSRDVMARIKAGESGVSFELPWWERFFGLFDVKPVFAGAFGMGVCALLISGVLVTDNHAASSGGPAVADRSTPVVSPVAIATPEPADASFVSSTNPPPPSLFGQFPAVQAQPAVERFWVPSRN